MKLDIGMKAQIRSMIFVAGEPIPYFWPMRAFIHHNPLHGLEKMDFEAAVSEGSRLFHGSGYLPRKTYQAYCAAGKIDEDALAEGVDSFLAGLDGIEGVDVRALLLTLLTRFEAPVMEKADFATASDISSMFIGGVLNENADLDTALFAEQQCAELLNERPLYEALDTLFGTGIGDELDELVIKSCLDFFDEGQSVWQMPQREVGFFHAWRDVAQRDAQFFLRGHHIREILRADDDPEGIIVHVLKRMGIPRQQWMGYFRRELSRLHGWAGFVRWREGARHYYHGHRFPADLVDLLAVRLTLGLALILERENDSIPVSLSEIEQLIRDRPLETCLRAEFFDRKILPEWAQRAEMSLLVAEPDKTDSLCREYIHQKRTREARDRANGLRQLIGSAGSGDQGKWQDHEVIVRLVECIDAFERSEGMLWLRAMEATAMRQLSQGVDIGNLTPANGRPFAQALFCIDTRSERLRRHLESVGDYQTFGIAGFFGIPVSFMELGKGNETHLCPVLLTPKNLVMEMPVHVVQERMTFSVLQKIVHELKETVLAPFVTVEAIGLLFGFDMFGKTLTPSGYNRWRASLHQKKPSTHLLIDKMNREQADSIIRAVQRAVIARAVEHEFEVPPEQVGDDLVRELRELALGHSGAGELLQKQLGVEADVRDEFVSSLRSVYRINAADARRQMERLGRIGFTLDEQVGFISQALSAIGLTENFSRFVLAVGHGSQSENNPYESALDCGACGGNLGLFNARIFANMANKPAVRKRLREYDIKIPEDTWFVPALHNTTTDEVILHDLEQLPSSHPVYLDRLQNGLHAACRLCTQERIPELDMTVAADNTDDADKRALRNSMDWSQVRPEWGLSRNAYFVIGRRTLTESCSLDGRAFLHSYDYRVDHNLRLLDNILTGPLVVAQWINMEHYFSTVDNEHYGSGSKAYHNVAGRFGVMTGNLSDLRTGLPAQTVLLNGQPYHEPMRLITVIEAPLEHVLAAIDRVAVVRRLLYNGWIRMMIIDPESGHTHVYSTGEWQKYTVSPRTALAADQEEIVS